MKASASAGRNGWGIVTHRAISGSWQTANSAFASAGRHGRRMRSSMVRIVPGSPSTDGDAVMAVWGAPTATRTTPSAPSAPRLELVDAVRVAGHRGSTPGRRADRRGGRHDRGHEPGHGRGRPRQHGQPPPVRRARRAPCSSARPRSARPPRAIAFEPAGEQTLKGKAGAGPGLASAAGRRASAAAAAAPRRSEAPFVGRDDELRLLKDLFHATAASGARGSSRSSGRPGSARAGSRWEFDKYLDGARSRTSGGTTAARRLRRGHHLLGARRDGPPPRPACVETDDEATTRAKIAETVAAARPRPDGAPLDRAARSWRCSASTWRHRVGRAVRRVADVLRADGGDGARSSIVFEDFHWADSGLARLRRPPARVVASAADLRRHAGAAGAARRRPDWGAGKRSFTSICPRAALRPAMRELLAGLVPGPARGGARDDRRPRRRHPALRRRDRPDARSPTGGSRSEDGVYRPAGDLTQPRRPGDAARR